MRRLLLVLLMLIMSAQWTWAAAASLCLHEVGGGAQHFGHHLDHEHGQRQAAAPDEAKQAAAEQGDLHDADCATCHAGAAGLLPLAEPLAPEPLLSMGRTPYRRSVILGLPERLIRPPHSRLA